MSGADEAARAVVDEDVWMTVDVASSVPAARRAAGLLAGRLGFDAARIGEVEIVTTELATNLVKHARGGDVALGVVARPEGPRVRVMTIDAGPGSRDIEALIADGVSTAGTLGIGLGAARRLATRLDLYSVPAVGTVAEAEFGPQAGTEPAPAVSWLTRPLGGTGVCGDAVGHRVLDDGRHLLVLADGLGHGPLAATASHRAVEVALGSSVTEPGAVMAQIHRAISSTRGAAVAVVRLDAAAGVLTYASVGNVSGRLLGAPRGRTLAAQPGIVGHRMPRLREQAELLEESAMLVLHSDGLSEKWSTAALPGVLGHGPGVVAGVLLREAGIRRDDASVLVARTTP